MHHNPYFIRDWLIYVVYLDQLLVSDWHGGETKNPFVLRRTLQTGLYKKKMAPWNILHLAFRVSHVTGLSFGNS